MNVHNDRKRVQQHRTGGTVPHWTLSVSSRRSKASTIPWLFIICLALSLIVLHLPPFFGLKSFIRFVFVDVVGHGE